MDKLVQTLEEQAKAAADKELVETGTQISDTKLAANMKAGGWTQAGFYYQIVSRFSADASAVQQMMPIASPGDAIGATSNPNGDTFMAVRSQMASWWPFGDQDGDAKQFLGEVLNTYNVSVNWWNESVARSNIRAFTNERQEFADTAGEMAAWIPSPGGLMDAFQYLDPSKGYNRDPLIALMTVGQSVSVTAGVTIIALAALAMGPFVGNAAVFVGTTVGWVLSGTAFVGVFISYILPLMPTLIWVISIGAFLLLVVEAIFAGPLWAIAHLSMDRTGGLAGPNARRGYVMLLALFMTPVLMLFGFLVGMAVFRVLGTLINGGFYYAMTGTATLTTDSSFRIMSVFGIFAALLMMGFLYIIIIERSFSFGADLPGRLLNRWFDNVSVDLDDQSAARARIGAAAGGAAAGGGLRSIGGQAQRHIERRRDLLKPPEPDDDDDGDKKK